MLYFFSLNYLNIVYNTTRLVSCILSQTDLIFFNIKRYPDHDNVLKKIKKN